MSNPNNCAACDHKRNPGGGWCYMFRDEPHGVCMKHSARVETRAVNWPFPDPTRPVKEAPMPVEREPWPGDMPDAPF